jgi:FkbM family methyltransferase
MKLLIDAGCNKLQGFSVLKNIENISDNDQKIFIEANPECWDFLEKDISNIPNSIFIKKALSTEIKETQLITRGDLKSDTGATILDKKFLEYNLNRWNIQVPNYVEYVINTTTVKEILESQKNNKFDCIVLKLDIEGMEYDVLQQIIDENIYIDKIYCEFHPHHSKEVNLVKIKLIKELQKKGIQILNWD